jgi:hypothetical protein
MLSIRPLTLAGMLVLLASFLHVTPAHALAASTWVSRFGNDGALCSRSDPCLTFQHAHDLYASFGGGNTISCLTSGSFGPLTISVSLEVDCRGHVAVTNAVIINGNAIVAILRGLTISGIDVGSVGVDFINGSSLQIENCRISGYRFGTGIGIHFKPAEVTADLFVADSDISNNGLPASGGGIVIQPSGQGSARVVLERVRAENNTYGIFGDGTGSTGVIAMQVRDSLAAGNEFSGISAYTSAGHSVTSVTLDRTSSLLNGGTGVLSQGPPAFVLLARSTVMSNGVGLSPVSGGSIISYQSNQLSGNVSDGTPSSVVTQK